MAYVSFLFYLQFNLKDPPVYILPYIHYITMRICFHLRTLHRNGNACASFLSSYACKSMPRKKKGKKMQENPRAFSEVDGSSFVDKIHLTKRKLRNWELTCRALKAELHLMSKRYALIQCTRITTFVHSRGNASNRNRTAISLS